MARLTRFSCSSTPLVAVGILTASLLWGASAQAQSGMRAFPNPAQRMLRQNTISRPTVSPYLNLIPDGDGTNPFNVARYQTFVRPQIEYHRAAQVQQSQINRLQQDLSQFNQQVSPAVSQAINDRPMMQQPVFQTGHPSYYGVYSHYYPGFGR